MDGMIKVNPGAIVDCHNAALGTFSGELDNIASEAQNLLGGIAEYFTTDQASVTYAQAQQMIIDATNEGKGSHPPPRPGRRPGWCGLRVPGRGFCPDIHGLGRPTRVL